MYLPTLTDNAKRVLLLIRDRGVVTGRELLSEANLSREDTMTAVADLSKVDLISVKGNIYNPSEFTGAYINVRPSNSGLLEFLIKS